MRRALGRQRPRVRGSRAVGGERRRRRRASSTLRAPSRLEFEMQSIPVSPPPITITRLPAAVISVPGCGHAVRAALLRRPPSGCAGRGSPSRSGCPRARGRGLAGRATRASRSRRRARRSGRAARSAETSRPDVDVVDELDALLLEDVHAPVDDPLLELGVGHAEAHQPAGALVALVHGHRVAAAVELGGDGQPGRAGADDGDRLAGPAVGRLGDDPALLRTRARRSPSRSARSSPGRR